MSDIYSQVTFLLLAAVMVTFFLFLFFMGVVIFVAQEDDVPILKHVPISPPVSDVDLQPLLPDIAEVIGWKDMQDVAMRSGMLNATIDACKLDHPGDSQEQTLQLLRIWQESQGREAGLNLIESLGKSGKKSKAGQVRDILLRGS